VTVVTIKNLASLPEYGNGAYFFAESSKRGERSCSLLIIGPSFSRM